tara:strand:+ start:547 stop:831 length:285 start_codon:yes stop_codon:yes gene_type:complete
MHFYLVQVLTICDTLGVVKGDTVMTEEQQKQMMDNMNSLIAQVVNVVKFEIGEITVERIRDIAEDVQIDEDRIASIANDEARDVVNEASISIDV